ncbi:membrane protein [Pluralibacter gergoviae]|uniref:two-component system QseEF-associated lipoprotein QseG n=1 Tax=Pluralibacter gergoviae TaxID=61647 RepID=UPI000651E069|nr:two-component system QseEF-associated lipoprotein QseG [Pluralibacter gergoviae]KMK16716.1 membrane protein [Pluralibacter gergoviae]
MTQKRVTILSLFRQFFASAACLLLAGCASSLSAHKTSSGSGEKLPEQQVADFLSTDCADIWSLQGEPVEKNPLYWLRSMDCASRLSSSEARREASRHPQSRWQEAFRRGILLANARITPPERREIVSEADDFSGQIPAHVRPLYQIWRDGQLLQLSQAEARMRYSQLQQTSDAELDQMRKEQQTLRSELELTTRKLENLTDIERQLSSRKPSGSSLLPDASHGDEDKEK